MDLRAWCSGWAGLTVLYGSLFSCHLGIATTTDGLRLGSSVKDISSGRPRGQKLVYPIAHIIITITTYQYIGYCLLHPSRLLLLWLSCF
jgi:hypothetical protein